MKAITPTLLLTAGIANAIQVDLSSAQSIKAATKTIANNIVSIYNGSGGPEIPGLFPKPYYFYEGGLAFDGLINYWSLTGDDSYNDLVSEALLFQRGDDDNYAPANQTKSLDNDDQSTWALACMTAAERGFPPPPSSSNVSSWAQLAQNVFDVQVARWDTQACGGGLRWQIFSFSAGYNYKNTISNGNFAQLAARLAIYTGNSTYSDWALKVSQWTFDVGLIQNGTFNVWDGADTTSNCKKPNRSRWTSNLGTYLSAYAYLSNVGNASQYHSYAPKLLANAIKTFATTPNSEKDGVLTEVACQATHSCPSNYYILRAILARALANAKYVDTGDAIDTTALDNVLKTSAEGAAAQCSGKGGSVCGAEWASSTWDGTSGLGQELSALEILLANLPDQKLETSSSSATPSGTASASPGGSSPTSAPGGSSPTSAPGTGSAVGLARSTVGLLAAFGLAMVVCL